MKEIVMQELKVIFLWAKQIFNSNYKGKKNSGNSNS